MNKELLNWQNRAIVEWRDSNETRRDTWRQNAVEIVCGIITTACVAALCWVWCAATPNQASAECEALRSEMEAAGK